MHNTTERTVVKPPGRPDLYNPDIFRCSILRKRTPQGTELLIRGYIKELLERKFHAFPKPTESALKYCLENIDALSIIRPHPKLLFARQILIDQARKMDIQLTRGPHAIAS